MYQPKELALLIAGILNDKKGDNVLVLDVAHLTSIADYFVICAGRSTTQVRALAEDVEEKMSEKGIDVRRRDGYGDSRWVVLDYASVIVHVFHEQEREYYNIERLWMDGSNQLKVEE